MEERGALANQPMLKGGPPERIDMKWHTTFCLCMYYVLLNKTLHELIESPRKCSCYKTDVQACLYILFSRQYRSLQYVSVAFTFPELRKELGEGFGKGLGQSSKMCNFVSRDSYYPSRYRPI